MKNHFLVEGNEGKDNKKPIEECFLDSFLISDKCQIEYPETDTEIFVYCSKRILLTITGVIVGSLLVLLVFLR